jgi:plastocyanin
MFSKTFFFALIPSILAASFSVSVGSNNGLTFDPTSVVADIGDTIIFTV